MCVCYAAKFDGADVHFSQQLLVLLGILVVNFFKICLTIIYRAPCQSGPMVKYSIA